MSSTFEPVTIADVKSAIARLIPGGNLDAAAARLAERPFTSTATLLGLTTVLFYMAERGQNARVNSIFDASVYCSASLNVGDCGIYPATTVGKMIGTLLMTIGPGLVTKVTDGARPSPSSDTQQRIVSTLEQILHELQKDKATKST